MAKRPTLNKTTSADAVQLYGFDEFQRALRHAGKDTRREIRQGNKEIADQVVKRMRHRARIVWNAEQYETIVPSIRAVQGTVPKVKAGGPRKARVSTRLPSGRRRRERPAAGDIFFGAEFGGRRTKETMQFPHPRKGGYVMFPTIRSMHGYIKKEYTRRIEDVLKKLGD